MIISFSSVQINCIPNQFEDNFNKAAKFLNNLPESERHLVLLPELWTSGFTDDLSVAHSANLNILNAISDIAKAKNLVIAGSYIINDDNKFFNQLIVINSNGKDIAKYNKNYLFPQLREKVLFSKGSTLSTLRVWGVKVSMAICYDLRFPELFRNYAVEESEICILPAQWPIKRNYHYKSLLMGRAIENQMIFLSTNTCGKIENTIFGGGSSLIDATGKIIFELNDKEQAFSNNIDIQEVFEWRENFPVLSDAELEKNKEVITYSFE